MLLLNIYLQFGNFRTIDTRIQNLLVRNKSQVTTYDEENDPSQPVRFSTSRAANWKTNYKNLIKEVENKENKQEQFARWLLYTSSYGVLVFYLFIREGNDLDDEQAMPLGKRMLQLQEYQLLTERSDGDSDEIDVELKKIADLRKKYNYV